MRDARAALAPGLDVQRVDGVGDEGEPIGAAKQPDQAGRVAGELDDLEARHLVALGDGALDRHRAAVPGRQHPLEVGRARRRRSLRMSQ